mgnify:FL=1
MLGPTIEIASVLSEYIARPLPWLLEGVADEQRKLGFPGAVPVDHEEPQRMQPQLEFSSVHVRRTDKLVGELAEAIDDVGTYTLDKYLHLLANMRPVRAPTSAGSSQMLPVYVATDSSSVTTALDIIQANNGACSLDGATSDDDAILSWNGDAVLSPQLNETLFRQQLKFLYNRHQQRYEKGTILSLRQDPGSVDQNEEGFNAFKDLWILSLGSYFIGTFELFTYDIVSHSCV